MLDELLVEKHKGRLRDPFVTPSDWGLEQVTIPGHPLLQLDEDMVQAAFLFSVEQPDKVRRIEDWTASYHACF